MLCIILITAVGALLVIVLAKTARVYAAPGGLWAQAELDFCGELIHLSVAADDPQAQALLAAEFDVDEDGPFLLASPEFECSRTCGVMSERILNAFCSD